MQTSITPITAPYMGTIKDSKLTSVLLIDDDQIDRRIISQMLPPNIYLVNTMSSISEAYEYMNGTDNIDCVLLDYFIPGSDTIQFLKHLCELHLPTIVITGHGNEEVAVEAMKIGAYEYLVKDQITVVKLQTAINLALKQHELQIKIMEQKAELECFAYTAAHDLRAPLRHIQSLMDLLLDNLENPDIEKLQHYKKRIQQNVTFMANLIDDLLEFAKLGDDSLRFEYVDLNETLSQVNEALSTTYTENNAAIHVNALPTIVCNEPLIRRLFENLLVNAIKYRHDSRCPEIQIRFDENKTHWHFSVIDNGRGIEEKFIEDVFKPFFTYKQNRQLKSAGLGLSICRKIVKKHQGKIWCTSTTNIGTIFNFTISKSLAISMSS